MNNMAVTNNLTKSAADKREAALTFEYESNNEKVKLSPLTVRNYLVRGGGNVTDQEVMMFMTLCKYQHLNPFLNEAYLIKFGSSPATIVTGKEVFTKRARKMADYAGKQSGIIVRTESGEIIEREGTFKLPEEELVGGWAKVYVKGYTNPEYMSVSFEEYVGRKKDGEINSQWATKPATMIRKVALMQALREAFPDDFEGMYSQEEIPEISDVSLDDIPINAEYKEVPQPGEPEPQEAGNDVTQTDAQMALFGSN